MKQLKISIMSGVLLINVVLLSTACGVTYAPVGSGGSYYPPASGGDDKSIKRACKEQIREKIKSDRRDIRKVEFTRGSNRIQRESHARSSMTGRGRFLNRKQRWKEFDFNCIYNHNRDRVVSATYRKQSNDDQDWNKPESGHDGRRACKRKTDKKILKKHESASRIRWNERSIRQWRESGAETGYRGTGQFVGGRGRTRHYEFQCIYNHRKSEVNSARVDIR